MNTNTPLIKVYVRNAFLFDQGLEEHQLNAPTGFTRGLLVGVRSIQGQAYQFHVLLNNGALFCGLPIHALAHKQDAPKRTLKELQMWDCLSYETECVEFRALRRMPVLVTYSDLGPGTYRFSLDCNSQHSSHSNLSETPDEWKLNHFIELEDGNFCIVPSYKLNFLDRSLCTNQDIGKYKTNTTLWASEGWK